MSEHSALPWKIDGANTSNFGSQIKTNSKVKASRVACRLGGQDRDANAALIVRAVNSHTQIVEALNKVNDWLVCHSIASDEDMAQSFPTMCKIVNSALASLKESA